MANRFGVFTRFSKLQGEENPNAFVVCEATADGRKYGDCLAAEFPVNARYSMNTQETRAFKFCDYLNSLVDVMNDLEKDQVI